MTMINTAGMQNWKFHMHAHKNSLEITYVFKGKGNYFAEGHIYPMQKGDLVIKNANVRHGENAEDDHPLEMIWIEISGIAHPDSFIKSRISPVFPTGRMENWFQETIKELYSLFVQKKQPEMQQALADSLTAVIKVIANEEKSGIRTSHGEDTIREIMQYLDMHYTEKIEIQDLSENFAISPYYLMRLFHRISGVTINNYVNNCRIGEAERLLVETDMALKEISDHCGYDTVQYFHQVFRKTAGMTPSQYRRKYKKENVLNQ